MTPIDQATKGKPAAPDKHMPKGGDIQSRMKGDPTIKAMLDKGTPKPATQRYPLGLKPEDRS